VRGETYENNHAYRIKVKYLFMCGLLEYYSSTIPEWVKIYAFSTYKTGRAGKFRPHQPTGYEILPISCHPGYER